MTKVVIFCGGLGTRIGSEVNRLPKPLVEVNGKPLIWHVMNHYSWFGFNEFILLAGYKQDLIKEYFLNYRTTNSDVIQIDIKSGKVGSNCTVGEDWNVMILNTGLETSTGGRLLQAKDWIGNERFLLAYADTLSTVNIQNIIDEHDYKHACHENILLTLTASQPHGRYGMLNINASGDLESIDEKPLMQDNWVNTGFMVCEPEIFHHTIDKDFSATLDHLARNGKASVYKHHGSWAAIDTQKDIHEYEAMLKIGEW